MQQSDNSKNPLISILMPVHNMESYVSEAIESVLSQTYTNFEFIIIDDGSTDNSKELIAQYQKNDQRIKFISRENKGIVYSRNELLSLAKGQYFAIMDSDDVSHPKRLELQLHFLVSNADYFIVGCRDLLIDPQGCPIRTINNLFEHEEIDRANLKTGEFLTLNAYMAVTKVVKDIGAYRENVIYAEDRDLFLRIAEIGKIKVLPIVLYSYRQHVLSTCVKKSALVETSVAQVINDAIKRRGLTTIASETKYSAITTLPEIENFYSIWAWWALESKHKATARKYAIKLFLIQPVSANTWRLVLCVLRDYFRKD